MKKTTNTTEEKTLLQPFPFIEGKDISKEVFITILRELNTQKEKTIRELAELGVEYVE